MKYLYLTLILLLSIELLLIIVLDYFAFNDIERSINNTATIIQTTAIIVGGIWAYKTFIYEKYKHDHKNLKCLVNNFDNEIFALHLDLLIDPSDNINSYKEKSHELYVKTVNEVAF